MKTHLPPNAKKVFQGQIFEVYQWDQQLYDGSIATFERLKRVDTAQVVAVVGDRILIQKQEQPSLGTFFSLPGGMCDSYEEPPLEAGKRELLEETGYQSDFWTLWRTHQPFSKIIWTLHTFFARNCVKIQEPALDAGEKIQNILMTFDEFLSLADEPTFRDADLIPDMLRAQRSKTERDAFKQQVFQG
ncbi:MAG TPA: NUDIX hydrolase [Patescibacteria group bacterium]|nr:NUDIX hydrolase [Patescibacteria group bacterium]